MKCINALDSSSHVTPDWILSSHRQERAILTRQTFPMNFPKLRFLPKQKVSNGLEMPAQLLLVHAAFGALQSSFPWTLSGEELPYLQKAQSFSQASLLYLSWHMEQMRADLGAPGAGIEAQE